MVKPIFLQDNLSKTWLAQQRVDQLLEGADRLRYTNLRIAQALHERRTSEIATEVHERPGTEKVTPDGKRRREPEREGGGQKADDDETTGESEEYPDRKRRPEDDEGKGSSVDILAE